MSDELHIYDFDGTLFRSPHAPAVWGKDWWSDPASLLPPCVPETPGSDWWVSPTVAAAKRSISSPDVFAVMLTGRTSTTGFRYRVAELLKQKGLNFDAVHLHQSGDSLMGKAKIIGKYLSRYPNIDTVRIWDDRGSHLRGFQRFLERAGYTVHTEHVRARSADPLCDEMDFAKAEGKQRKPSYVGVFLDSRSKAALVQAYNLSHDKVKNDHVTLGFKLTPELEGLIGTTVQMKVVGYGEDALGQAVVVKLPGTVPFNKKGLPHVTLTHDRSVGPKYSNDLLAGGYDRGAGPALTGVIDTFPRRLRRRTASNVRVAARYKNEVVAKEVSAAGSQKDITDNLVAFERAYDDFKEAVQDGMDRRISGDNHVVRMWANKPWVQLIQRGYKIAEGILGTRSIPARQAKGMEMAHRLYGNSRKMPKDVYKWWKTNEKRLLLTIMAAKKWPEKQEGSDALFRVGPFLVHNAVGATGQKLEVFKKMLETAIKKVKGIHGVPGFQKVLYGDIYLVGQISKAHHAAWYAVTEDAIYCRVTKAKWGFDEAFALVHELAHRYWRKFMSREAKAKWGTHHYSIKFQKVDLPMPQVGDPLPVRFRGAPKGWRPTVEEIKHGEYWYRTPNDRLTSISAMRIRKVVDQTKGVELRFPTAYSAQNEEEHFCEAVASEAFGSLSTAHTKALMGIW